MTDTLTPLILDLLESVAPAPRPYADVMDAWRTSCPRLPVWEEATDRGFVAVRISAGEPRVELTAKGARFLREHRTGV